MTMLLTYPKPRPWSKAEYHQAIDLGWFEGQRAELINGEVLYMPPQHLPHSMAILLVERALREAFGAEFMVRGQMPMIAGDRSEPEPDVAVVKGSIRDLKQHPTTAELVVEISESSLHFDRTRKAALYASCKVPDYWIINLAERQLEVRRNPVADRRKEFGHDYSELTIYQPGDKAAPLARPRNKIKIADLLP